MRIHIFQLTMLLCIALGSCGNPAPALSAQQTLTGKVIAIQDGDTYDLLLDNNTTQRIRMEGIDAPEKGMPFYKTSKQYLASLCFGKQVTVKVTGDGGSGRLLGFTYLEDGSELSHAMLKAGMAWHFKKYNDDPDLAQLETTARKMKTGLWVDPKPMAPWDNRSLHREGISTKDSFATKPGQE